MNISVFNYNSSRQFLLDYLQELQEQDSSYSVRKWSKQMQMKSHSLLVLLLQGKRAVRIQHCDVISRGMNLTSDELSFFKTLVQFENAKGLEEKAHAQSLLNKLHPGESFKVKEISEYKVISDWIYMAIMAMTELKDFKGTEEEICKRLKGQIDISKVRGALVRLMDLKLLTWNEAGKLVPTFKSVSTANDVENEAAKKYHSQVMELAKEALVDQELGQREFQAFSMAIAKEKVPMAKKMIREFRKKLSQAVSGDGDNVYQTNIQFFQLTKDPKSSFEEKPVAKDKNMNKELENVIH